MALKTFIAVEKVDDSPVEAGTPNFIAPAGLTG
jgi:hypothetical protein